jgi:hypothetical protein
MQRERRIEQRKAQPAPGGPASEALASPAERARAAAASAAAVEAEPVGIAVRVRTTVGAGAGALRLVATPDTSIAELFDEACRGLGIEDADGFALVAGGRVLGDGALRLGELAGELGVEEELAIRLVRRPEAGGAACPC